MMRIDVDDSKINFNTNDIDHHRLGVDLMNKTNGKWPPHLLLELPPRNAIQLHDEALHVRRRQRRRRRPTVGPATLLPQGVVDDHHVVGGGGIVVATESHVEDGEAGYEVDELRVVDGLAGDARGRGHDGGHGPPLLPGVAWSPMISTKGVGGM